MDVKTIHGSCEAYAIGDLLIDAPADARFPQGIKRIIITHEHCDHIAGLAKLDGEVLASRFAIDSIKNKEESSCLCHSLGMDYPKITKTKALDEGDAILGDGFSLTVIETPGHCRGALCLYAPEEKALFSGDTVFPGLALPRTDLPTSDDAALIRSYEKLAKLDIRIIYPGHGKPIKEKKYVEKVLGLLV